MADRLSPCKRPTIRKDSGHFFDQKKLAAAQFDSTVPADQLAVAIQDALTQPANKWQPAQQYSFDGRSPDRFRDLFTRLCSSIA